MTREMRVGSVSALTSSTRPPLSTPVAKRGGEVLGARCFRQGSLRHCNTTAGGKNEFSTGMLHYSK
jgi:hypothetical protein